MLRSSVAMTAPPANQQLITRGAQFSVGPLARAAGAILLLPVVTRVLAPDALGLVSTAQVFTSVLVAVAALGLDSAAMREYFGTNGQPGSPGLARSLSVAAVVATALVVIGVHLSGPLWIGAFEGLSYDKVMVLAVAVAVPMELLLVGQNLLRSADRPKPFTAAVLIATLGGQFLGLAIAAVGDHTAFEYLVGVAIGFTVGAFIATAYAGLRAHPLAVADLTAGLRLGLPTIPHSLGIFVLQMGDRLVIMRSLGLDAVGRYQVAYLVGSIGIPLVIAFNAAWTPIVLRIDDDTERWKTLADTTALVHWLTGIASSGIVLLAPVALAVAAPASYGTSGLVTVVGVVAPAAVLYTTFQGSSIVLLQLRRTGRLGLASLLAAVLNLGLSFLMVAKWDLAGAALATTITYAAWAFAIRYLAGQLVQVHWDDNALLGSLALVGACIGLSAALGDSLPAQITRVAAGAVVGVVGLSAVWRRRPV